tara:strand:- start:84 stop:617 length:534 start_codon:yes stop_codon:yes gene_type:complete
MLKTEEERDFLAVNIAVLTISDSRTLEDDKSGNVLVNLIKKAGHNLAARDIISDDIGLVVEKLNSLISNEFIDVVVATGGTGVTGRDITPEAFGQVYEKEIPGFGELFRWISYQKIATSTIQSRATAGVAGGTYLFSLPGSPGACKDAWDEILIHQLDVRHKPCNFVELMPRLKENL